MSKTYILKNKYTGYWDEKYLTQMRIFFIETRKKNEKCLPQV